jgi:hypothetical protein
MSLQVKFEGMARLRPGTTSQLHSGAQRAAHLLLGIPHKLARIGPCARRAIRRPSLDSR